MQQVNQFNPSIMQNLLGKHYKWWYIFQYSFRLGTAYRGSTIFYMVGRLMVLAMTIFIWQLNIQAGSGLVSFKTIFTYYIIGSLFAWENGMNWNLASSIMSGGISSRLLVPLSFFKVAFLRDFGWWLFSNLFQTLLFIGVLLVGHDYIAYSSPTNTLLYIFLSFISYFILGFIGIIIGSTAFYFTDINGLMGVQNDLRFYLSGRAIPLNVSQYLIPITYLPYALTFYWPVQIFIGNVELQNALKICGVAVAWCLALYYLAKLVFKKGLKRNEAVGL
jgi:ABC-2 type transport system permease protein